MNKLKTVWNITVDDRKHSKWDLARNFFINLDDKQFMFWRWQLELIASVHFAKK